MSSIAVQGVARTEAVPEVEVVGTANSAAVDASLALAMADRMLRALDGVMRDSSTTDARLAAGQQRGGRLLGEPTAAAVARAMR